MGHRGQPLMAFLLHVIDADTGCVAELEFSDADRELLDLQMLRCVACGGLEHFARWLSFSLKSSLPSVLDYGLRPPSEAQVHFALAIARTLGVALPPDVLRYRGAMHDFISSHKDAFDAQRKTRRITTSDTEPGEGSPD
jgi:hypothetical protein